MEPSYLKNIVSNFHSYTDSEKYTLLKKLHEEINSNTVLLLHPFFISLTNYIIFENLSEEKLELLRSIEKRIMDHTKFTSLKIFNYKNLQLSKRSREQTVFEKFTELIKIKLISNKLTVFQEQYDRYFNIKKRDSIDIQQLILDNIETIDVKNIAYLIDEEVISENFLTKLYDYPEFTRKLFYALYIENEELYNMIVYKIFYENYHITPLLMESLVNLSFDTMPLYNYEIMSFFIKKREFLYEKIIEKCKELDKSLLLSLATSHYEFFIKHIAKFSFQFNDLIYVASKEPKYLYYLYDSQLYSSTFNYNSFCKSISLNSADFITEFFTSIISRNNFKECEHNEKIIVTYLTYTAPTDELIQLFSSNYLDSRTYFSAIIKILPKETIYAYLNKYLVDEEMVDIFCTVLTPNEILYRAHHFIPLKRAVEATKLCFDKKDVFTEDILAQTLNLLENDNNIFFMRTLCFSLLNFPNLKKFIIQILKQLKLIFWTKSENIEGFIKACELLKADCLPILNELDFNFLNKIFNMGKELEKNARNYIYYNRTPYKHLMRYFNIGLY